MENKVLRKIMKIFKRLFCLHLNWEKSPFPDSNKILDMSMFGYWTGHRLWKCKKCGKLKLFPVNNPPIQFLEKPL